MKKSILPLLCSFFLATSAIADASRPGAAEPAPAEADRWAFKLTPSYYSTTNERPAADLNLRANTGPHALWLGHYRRGDEFSQTRAGYELTLEWEKARLIPSLQAATHGFVGGSVNVEAGSEVFALLGLGRTNARDYYNLNFDPNDSVTYGLGTRLLPRSQVSLYTVKDNRLHTGQVVTHAVIRYRPDEVRRLTLDLFGKHGRAGPEEERFAGTGFSLTYDHRAVFVRFARDRKVNFSADDQTRVSLGIRF